MLKHIPRPTILKHLIPRPVHSRTFTTAPRLMAEGDTGGIRHGGEKSADTWSRREKAAEDMYIRQREKEIMALLREKIRAQQLQLEKDRAVLSQMEDQYGHHTEKLV